MLIQIVLLGIPFIANIVIIILSLTELLQIFRLPAIDYSITVNKSLDCILSLAPVCFGFLLLNVFWEKNQLHREFISSEAKAQSFLLQFQKLIYENGELIQMSFDPNNNQQKFERDNLVTNNYLDSYNILLEIIYMKNDRRNGKVEHIKSYIKLNLLNQIKKCIELSRNHYGKDDELSAINSIVGNEINEFIILLRRK